MKKIVIALMLPIAVFAQLSVTNLAEYQLGNLPGKKPDNLSTLYNQTNIQYRQQKSTVGIRLEHFQSIESNQSFGQLSQRYVQWQDGPIKIRLGNFYNTIGRGLIMRTFELPNIVFEQRQFRRRYGYYRDTDGVLAQGTWKRFEFSAFYGQPLNETIPPGLEDTRRGGTLQGGQVKTRLVDWLNVGSGYVRAEIERAAIPQNEMVTVFFDLNLSKPLRRAGLDRSSFKIYGEQARSNSRFDNFLSTGDERPHARYLTANFSYNRFGLSAEYKAYDQFENTINVPPLGYMEHSYYLLNRVTHELLAENENGYQFEATYRVHDNLFLLFNTSHAVNDLYSTHYTFDEKMGEATFYFADDWSGKVFYNQSFDELRSELHRQTGGLNLDWTFYQNYSLSLDAQHQQIDRGFASTVTETFDNSFLALTFSSSPTFSISVVAERSTDSGETDKLNTPDIERSARYWYRIAGAYQINMDHELVFFYGARRGGLACTSGTCYEVLPFEGFEVRWVAHF